MRRTLIGLTLVAGLVAACGGSTATAVPQADGSPAGVTTQDATTQAPAVATPTQAAAVALDACSLITAAEVAAVLGQPVASGVVPEPGASSCIFVDSAKATNSVEISITRVADFNPNQKSITGLTITPVSGVGDAAYYVNLGGGYDSLKVRKGQTTFSVSVLLKGASDSQLEAAEKTLAVAAAGRI